MFLNINISKENLKRAIDYEMSENKNNEKLNFEYDSCSSTNKEKLFIKSIEACINNINSLYPNNNFEITFNCIIDDYLNIKPSLSKYLEKTDAFLRKNYNKQLYISEKTDSFKMHGLQDTLTATKKLNHVAEKIKNTTITINNEEIPLSTFEKFMLAYEFVTDFIYKEVDEDESKMESRHWIHVLNGDKIVCVGYASLLNALCEKIFNPKDLKCFCQDLYLTDSSNEIYGHKNNIIYIKDEKYNIEGMFYADSCWDSINKNRPNKPQAYCCIPILDIINEKKQKYHFRDIVTQTFISIQSKRKD